MTRPIRDLPSAVRALGALPVPMTRPIADLGVPLPRLKQQMRELVARQRQQQAGLAQRSAERLTAVLAPTPTTPEEGQL